MKLRLPRVRRGSADSAWSGPRSLVASGLGEDTGGGVYVLETEAFSRVDAVSTTGLTVSGDGARLARLLWNDDDVDAPGAGEVLVYDSAGVVAYHRVDELREPHSALWDGNLLAVVSTGTNTVLWLDSAGSVRRSWKAPGEGDSWHLNSLSRRGRKLLVSAFGRFEKHRAWSEPGARDGRGFILELPSGREVLGRLSAPHNPLWLDGRWLVCNSEAGELVTLDKAGERLEGRHFEGWTRGLTYDEHSLYLGVSAHRLRGAAAGTAFVVAMDRETLVETERWRLPCSEIYDLIVVPSPLVEGLRVGFHTDSPRALGRDRAGRAPP